MEGVGKSEPSREVGVLGQKSDYVELAWGWGRSKTYKTMTHRTTKAS